jgi:hypothetical protein
MHPNAALNRLEIPFKAVGIGIKLSTAAAGLIRLLIPVTSHIFS